MNVRYIKVIFFDPFDMRLLSELCISYDRRHSAQGRYSRHVKKMIAMHKTMDSNILQGRTPKTKITFLTK